MIDATNDLSQMDRGLLFYNCPNGLLVKDDGFSGVQFNRRSSSNTMKLGDKTFHRTGEISKSEDGSYHIIFRLKSCACNGDCACKENFKQSEELKNDLEQNGSVFN